jgi:archaemetzincin
LKLVPKKPVPRPFLKRPLTWANVLLLAGLATFWLFFRPLPTVGGGEPDSAAATALKARVYAAVSRQDEVGFRRIDPANPGGWLLSFREAPQSLETYQSQSLIRPTPARRTIVLQPVGAMSAADALLLEKLRAYTEGFFGLPARVVPQIPLPAAQGDILRGNQFHAGRILSEVLQPRVAPDAMVTFGITNADLWSEELSFVFGVGDDKSVTGVMSLARLRPSFWHAKPAPDGEARVLRRACRLLSHEVGHVLGMWHCVFYKCVMNGSNSLLEADAQPLHLCPVCHRKLAWNTGADGSRRYSQLLGFYRAHRMNPEAEWMQARLERWKKIAARVQTR